MPKSTVYRQLAADSEIGLNPPSGTSHVTIQAQVQALRFTLDGSTPSTSHGEILPVNTVKELRSPNIKSFKGISDVAGCLVAVHYFGE